MPHWRKTSAFKLTDGLRVHTCKSRAACTVTNKQTLFYEASVAGLSCTFGGCYGGIIINSVLQLLKLWQHRAATVPDWPVRTQYWGVFLFFFFFFWLKLPSPCLRKKTFHVSRHVPKQNHNLQISTWDFRSLFLKKCKMFTFHPPHTLFPRCLSAPNTGITLYSSCTINISDLLPLSNTTQVVLCSNMVTVFFFLNFLFLAAWAKCLWVIDPK